MFCAVAGCQFDLVGSLRSDDALLDARGGFREDVARVGVAVDIPRFGTAVRTFG